MAISVFMPNMPVDQPHKTRANLLVERLAPGRDALGGASDPDPRKGDVGPFPEDAQALSTAGVPFANLKGGK
jgi:hypothetical protein